MRRLLPVALLALAVAVTACGPSSPTAAVARGLEPGDDGWHGLPLEVDRTMPDVRLTDVHGDPVDLAADTAGDPTLLFFGYTHCPDICPVHMAAIAAAMRAVDVTTHDLDVVFVSVDPERDTPERIGEWLGHFDSRFVGLHGDIDVIADALGRLDLPGPVVEGPDPRGEGDLIGHPAQVIGFDADGRAQRAWPFGTRRADWVNDLPRIVEEWS